MIRTVALALAFAYAVNALADRSPRAREAMAAGELHDICAADHGRLWGASLCGPLIVVDPQTRSVWASQADAEGVLLRNEGGWIGRLPQGVTVANTSVEWAGVRWIMVMGPLPESAIERRVLVAHEAWHRVQGRIDLAAVSSENRHLESERGRYLLRLELRALERAMTTRGQARWRAAADALLFRATRLHAFEGAAAEEAALDRNEGLAAYTGMKLGAGRDAFSYAARTLSAYDHHNAYARAYAYASGPAYGLLLDQRDRSWRRKLGPDAPADLLTRALRAASDAAALPSAEARYGGLTIASEERARAEAQAALIADLRARFAEGPRLVLPLQQMQFEMDPNRVTPVDGLGSVYGVLTLRDAWGEIAVHEGGGLISPDFTQLTVPRPAPDGLSGPGWTLRLNPGFQVTRAGQEGVISVSRVPQGE